MWSSSATMTTRDPTDDASSLRTSTARCTWGRCTPWMGGHLGPSARRHHHTVRPELAHGRRRGPRHPVGDVTLSFLVGGPQRRDHMTVRSQDQRFLTSIGPTRKDWSGARRGRRPRCWGRFPLEFRLPGQAPPHSSSGSAAVTPSSPRHPIRSRTELRDSGRPLRQQDFLEHLVHEGLQVGIVALPPADEVSVVSCVGVTQLCRDGLPTLS